MGRTGQFSFVLLLVGLVENESHAMISCTQAISQQLACIHIHELIVMVVITYFKNPNRMKRVFWIHTLTFGSIIVVWCFGWSLYMDMQIIKYYIVEWITLFTFEKLLYKPNLIINRTQLQPLSLLVLHGLKKWWGNLKAILWIKFHTVHVWCWRSLISNIIYDERKNIRRTSLNQNFFRG